jgi:hypothetical protein
VSAQPRRSVGRPEKLAHLAWAALSIAAAATPVLVPQHGHPPPLILLPVVALAWPLGHAAIRGVAFLAALGRRAARVEAASAGKWPVALVIVLLGTGIASVLGLALFALSGAQLAEAAGFPALLVVVTGTMTGFTGGVRRGHGGRGRAAAVRDPPGAAPVSGARGLKRGPARHAHQGTDATQLPWKPGGIRCGMCTRATGSSSMRAASRMASSLQPFTVSST